MHSPHATPCSAKGACAPASASLRSCPARRRSRRRNHRRDPSCAVVGPVSIPGLAGGVCRPGERRGRRGRRTSAVVQGGTGPRERGPGCRVGCRLSRWWRRFRGGRRMGRASRACRSRTRRGGGSCGLCWTRG
ncbi:hypothetical protein BDZ85DRAFT_264024 [Elsinoe ampelina]|uniref:Uncharacterized protein n=1 Tax=Elsinoe ampelina TaxID=302913 RepID=A0A6A6GA93_9PEZI|nr:hypothetical protein BDZ85DRAFT_264024 [Elsinoe ampelina]